MAKLKHPSKNKYPEDYRRIVALSLKLPLLNLNKVKQLEFLEMERINTALANDILKISDFRKLTSKDFNHLKMASGFVNQTLKNCRAKTKVKNFKRLPLETNNQNWKLSKVGNTYSVSFNLYRRGIGTRIPVEVYAGKYTELLDKLINGVVKSGTLKLFRSRKGVWYALISLSYQVELSNPKLLDANNYIGVDRGQKNVIVMSAPACGQAVFVSAGKVKNTRRVYAKRRAQLQADGKHRAVKNLEHKEQRILLHENHKISKQIVEFAVYNNAGICFEDLSGIRRLRQLKKVKSDTGHNKDYWSYYQLEQMSCYKAAMKCVHVEWVPAAYTSQTCSSCGVIGRRSGIEFKCVNSKCLLKIHADLNASRNISNYMYRQCRFDPRAVTPVISAADQDGGLNERALNFVIPEAGSNVAKRYGREEESPVL